ncbi:MAG: hypothetical protein ACAI35_07420 [Candidatus Methylacidiphilales bacterium]
MKLAANIAGGILGFIFGALALMFLLNMFPEMPKPPEGSAQAHFFAAFGPTGYLKFVKVLELVGGILVAIPLTRNLGLLILGPIMVNILAFHFFVTTPADLLNPMIIGLCALLLFLLWAERHAFAGLVKRS